MTSTTRLFRSPWPYLGGLALFLCNVWHDVHPHPHPAIAPWHPAYNTILLTSAGIFCFCLMFSLVRSTNNALERAMLALLAIAFALSAVIDIHRFGLFHTSLPSFRLVFLSIDTLLALLTAIRFIQVLREPASPGMLSGSPPSTNY